MATTFDLDMAPTTHSVYLGCHPILLVVYKKTKPSQLYPEIKHLKCVKIPTVILIGGLKGVGN